VYKCDRCDQPLTKANLRAGGFYVLLEKSQKGVFASPPQSDVSAYVCPSCGRVQLYADSPEAFRSS